jgi:hypothetical protein
LALALGQRCIDFDAGHNICLFGLTANANAMNSFASKIAIQVHSSYLFIVLTSGSGCI